MWISVEDELPVMVGHYRVCLDDGTIMKAHYHPDRKFTRFFQHLNRVTHWRYETKAERYDWNIVRRQPLTPPEE